MKIETDDYIGISFYITKFFLFFTAFFLLLEKKNIDVKFATSNNVSIIILLIAATHYYYMKNIWLTYSNNPIVYRYMDWFLTVPLQIIEFYLIVKIINNVSIKIFYKLLICSILMLLFGFLGEIKAIDRTTGFILGSIFWLIVVYEIYYGKLAQKKNEKQDKKINFIYNNLKYIITFGWLIYPIGYLLNNNNMIIVYNLADFINKILFAIVIWFGAKYV
jgi:bacteriorhodopsin